ncbi:sulfite exporter TauE/SafE family protein [Mangrovicoccus algicola]|uniref:Probable membrane transporter protein n=1 Tax=Mangrovicoccus algicola TaxID=2771008 RepID=A0A8J6Z6N3_9RHOB|nr:sulfite exporter TauE/SafE family protein [Mangrovicoccus algicola]MBE3637151.1 sulfite exporter TauE/SafE family protein [Mangrovicoccus algicola]
MTELIHATLALPGLLPVLLVTFAAGLVYGFAGFGAALIYMPLATVWVDPSVAVAGLSLSALASLVTVVPRAIRQVEPGPTLLMVAAAFLTAPLGIWVLRSTDPLALRWITSACVALTLAGLMTGWRYRAVPGRLARAAVGAATGIVGGATGLSGPVVILFHLGGQGSAAANRANTLVFLTFLSLLLLPQLAFQGLLSAQAIGLGLLQLLPYAAGCRLGQALFDPARERLYRRSAYLLIAVAVLLGLPLE